MALFANHRKQHIAYKNFVNKGKKIFISFSQAEAHKFGRLNIIKYEIINHKITTILEASSSQKKSFFTLNITIT